MGSMTGAIIRNFASIQPYPGAGEPGGPGLQVRILIGAAAVWRPPRRAVRGNWRGESCGGVAVSAGPAAGADTLHHLASRHGAHQHRAALQTRRLRLCFRRIEQRRRQNGGAQLSFQLRSGCGGQPASAAVRLQVELCNGVTKLSDRREKSQ